MPHPLRPPLLLAAAIASTPALADMPSADSSGTRLEFTARGEAHRAPDLATLTAGVVTDAASAAAAMQDNAGKMTAVIAALKRAGVAPQDIRTASLNLQPRYRSENGQAPAIAGYEASNEVTVTFHDIARAGAILDALAGQGVNRISGPSFGLEHPEAALDEARVEAVQDARRRAELYARAAGLTVRRIVSISESGGEVGSPIRPLAFSAMRKAETPIEPGEQDVTVTLQVAFELGRP